MQNLRNFLVTTDHSHDTYYSDVEILRSYKSYKDGPI